MITVFVLTPTFASAQSTSDPANDTTYDPSCPSFTYDASGNCVTDTSNSPTNSNTANTNTSNSSTNSSNNSTDANSSADCVFYDDNGNCVTDSSNLSSNSNSAQTVTQPTGTNISSQSQTNNIPYSATSPALTNTSNTGSQAPSVNATNVGQQAPSTQTFTLQNPLKVNSVGDFIKSAVTIFTYLVILFAVLAFVWVGFQYILARGDPGKMKELSSWLLAIVIGVAIVIGARLMIQIVINTLSATGVVNSNVIQSANNALQNK